MSRDIDAALLAEQLLLLEEKKREVSELLRRGDRPSQEIADELVGIRMVILAALLQGIAAPAPSARSRTAPPP